MKKLAKIAKIITFVCLGVIALVITIVITGDKEEPKPQAQVAVQKSIQEKPNPERFACLAAKHAVRSSLPDPDKAEFPACSQMKTNPVDNHPGRYVVLGWVKAHGVKKTFWCVVEKDGDNWKYEPVKWAQ